jgi:hypothetical protein
MKNNMNIIYLHIHSPIHLTQNVVCRDVFYYCFKVQLCDKHFTRIYSSHS